MTSEEMAKLFDLETPSVDDGSSGDYDTKAQDAKVATTFVQKVEDLNSVLEEAPIKKIIKETTTDAEIIKTAAKQPSPPQKIIEDDSEDGDAEELDDVIEEVDKDIAEFAKDIESSDNQESMSSGDETKTELKSDAEIESEIPDIETETDDNPLSLKGDDFKIFTKVKNTIPQFCVYDGTVSFKDFYRSKVSVFKSLLTRFHILDLKEMTAEVKQVNLDHFIGDDYIHPELIRKKLDDSYRCRTRLAFLLVDALEQVFVWRRMLELLRAKLFKDHEVKGIHRREGMALEHIGDIERYVNETEGFIESAKHIDSMLKAAAESLSRQLTCLQLKEATGFSQKMDHSTIQKNASSSKLDSLDSIQDGHSISAPLAGKKVPLNFGSSNDVGDLDF